MCDWRRVARMLAAIATSRGSAPGTPPVGWAEYPGFPVLMYSTEGGFGGAAVAEEFARGF
jgi:hypothetical protein